jgi:hypothetical protein
MPAMPTDVLQLRAQIAAFADRQELSGRDRAAVMPNLLAPLEPTFDGADALLAACLAASRVPDRPWAGALFTQGEPVNLQTPCGSAPERYALIATDGSQILPDRHRPVQFAYIQAGCACVTYGAGADQSLGTRLHRLKRSRLIHEDELYDPDSGELKPSAEISNQRDAMEIQLLAEACEVARSAGFQPIAVADGSIVPFALLGSRNIRVHAQRLLPPIVRALDALRECGALVCGYIDRPNSNAVTRACALNGADYDKIDAAFLRANEAHIRGIADRHLMEIQLRAGHRSATFDPHWEVNELFGAHAMRACYVNFGAGAGRRAVIGRIETPQWCMGQIDVLAKVLYRHAMLGEGYPLILKAAHDESVISKDDAREIEHAIEQTLVNRGIVQRLSNKQSAKDRA